jgi:hypothetical protein
MHIHDKLSRAKEKASSLLHRKHESPSPGVPSTPVAQHHSPVPVPVAASVPAAAAAAPPPPAAPIPRPEAIRKPEPDAEIGHTVPQGDIPSVAAVSAGVAAVLSSGGTESVTFLNGMSSCLIAWPLCIYRGLIHLCLTLRSCSLLSSCPLWCYARD